MHFEDLIPEKLNLASDDTIWVASDLAKLSLRAFRSGLRFEPDKFIDRLQLQFNKGTLLIPAFVNQKARTGSFDMRGTVPETGSLSITAFKRTDFVRTPDPFHSFMVWGKHAEKLATIHSKSSFGADSVFAFLHLENAKILMIDIDFQHCFTFAHFVEEQEKVQYRTLKNYTIDYNDLDGKFLKKKFQLFEKKTGVALDLNGLRQLFLSGGASQEQLINNSLFTVVDLRKSYDLIRNDIRTNNADNLHKTSSVLFAKTLLKKLRP